MARYSEILGHWVDEASLSDFMNSRKCEECELSTCWSDMDRNPTHCVHCGEPFEKELADEEEADG